MLGRLVRVFVNTSSSTNRSDYQPISSPLTPSHSRRNTLTPDPLISRSRSSSVHSIRHPHHDTRIRRAHLILGAASLLSWNAMITATPYYASRLVGSSLQSTFASYLSATFTLSGFLALAHVTRNATKGHASQRIRPSALVLLACIFALSLSPFITLSPSIFFAFIVVNAAIQAWFGAYFQSAVVALASLFGPYAVQATFAGQAAVGVLVSTTQFFVTVLATQRTTGGSDADASFSAFVFFTVSTAFLVLTLAVHAWLVRLPAYVEVVKPHHVDPEDEEATESEEGDTEDDELEADNPLVSSIHSVDHLLGVRDLPAPESEVSVSYVARLNAPYNVAVGLVFIVTLSVFPPITASIQPVGEGVSPGLFNAFHFVVFNIGDYVGRALCSYPQFLMWSRKRLLSYSLCRTLFIPLFLACNIQRPSASLSSLTQPTVNSDFLYLLILLAFGITNGHASTLCMMAASSPEHNKRLKREQVEVAATIAQFCLVGGLAVGSFMSFGVRSAVCGWCNPFKG